MFSSIVNCPKLLLLNIQRKLTTFQKLNWKIKLFIFLQLLICLSIAVIYLIGSKKNYHLRRLGPKKEAHTPRPWRDSNFENVTNVMGGLGELAQKEIIILQWTTFWAGGRPAIVFNPDMCSILKTGTTQQPPISGLFDKPCRITLDHRYMRGSQAVVFHSPDLGYFGNTDSDLPRATRPQNQIWVWYQTEAPVQKALLDKSDLKAFQNSFNWTMSYRRDSDVYSPYGYIFPSNISNSFTTSSSRPTTTPSAQHNQTSDHYRKSLKMKSGLAAWIVSTCVTPSKRENFVKELQKYIPVDIFGTCGKKPCTQLQEKGYLRCYKHIQSKYKFYLAFENSLCVDYVSEKFYLALQTDMVPVVYGGGIDNQMDYLAIAPPNSFVDARRFKSPKELANYLVYLDKNDEEYLKYFEWKGKYEVIYKDYWQYGLGWCNLCQRVFEQMKKREEDLWNKWYSDLYTWWNYKSEYAAVSLLGQSFQLSGAKLKPTCVPPKNNFTPYD